MFGDRTTSQCNHVSAQIEFCPTSEIKLFRFQKHLKNGNKKTVEVERCFWTTWRTTLREHLCMDWSETFKRCQMSVVYLLAGTSPSLVGLTLNGSSGFSSAVQELSLQFSSSSQVIQISTWYLWYFLNLLFGLTATPLDTGVEKYINDPTSTTLETTDYPIWNIDFPGVTICPNAKVFHIKKIKN